MTGQDYRPLVDTPVTDLISSNHDNRLGAVYNALYSFWCARNAAFQDVEQRLDAYSVILFNHNVHRALENDEESTPRELLERLLEYSARGHTDYTSALNDARELMDLHWDGRRCVPITCRGASIIKSCSKFFEEPLS